MAAKFKSTTIEINNGLLGVIIPSEKAFQESQPSPAPIQSFIYADGTRSNDRPVVLKSPTPATSMQVTFITRSSALVSVKITYRFQKKEFQVGKEKYPGGEAGPGFYTCMITVKKGEKTITIEEDSDYDISYKVPISNGLLPDRTRYRGWASSAVKNGYETPGKVYRSESERGFPMDASVDLDYSKSFQYPLLVLWEPAGGELNSGRYWQIYNSTATKKANLFGFFQGRPEKLIGGRSVGVRLEVSPKEQLKNVDGTALLSVSMQRRGPDNSWYPRKRFEWCAFISTKVDLLPPEQQQPIATAMNKISGLGSKIYDYASKPGRLVSSFYHCAIYLPKEDIDTLRKKIKTDISFYRRIVSVDDANKVIWDAWRYPDSAQSLKQRLLKIRETLQHEYVYGEGTYLQKYRYWKGSNLFKTYALQIAGLLSDEQIMISADEKKRLEQLVGLMARIVWDNNNVPLFSGAGINYGPANMPLMYNNTRIFFALLLANDPEFKLRAQEAVTEIKKDLGKAIYENGSGIGTPHYMQPALEPTLYSMLQLREAGLEDCFASQARVEGFARFYLSLLTPPSVRFNNNRKLISIGDGSEESTAIFALLATGFKKINRALAEELQSAFIYGPARASAFGPIGLSVDLSETTERKFSGTTSNYTGYVSHFRSGLNTDRETALWLLNGNKLYDHRNDDAGEMMLYALKAPLSLSRSSFYYPSATDARIRSVVVPEKMFPEWNQSNQPISGRSLTNRTWPQSELIAFAHLGRSSTATVKMGMKNGTTWFRKVNMFSIRDELPVICLYDSIPGNELNIWSMLMMSEGAVHTPAGSITPEKRIYDNNKRKELPQATPEKKLPAGLNRFAFTGQEWISHPSRGINWDLYTLCPSEMHFSLAEWGTTWQNSIEKNEFRATNKRPYSEEQQILRMKSSGPFFNVLLPYKKGQNPYQGKVQSNSSNCIRIGIHGNEIIIHPDHYVIKTGETFYGALLSASGQLSYNNITISGGYTELEYDAQTVKIRLHGNTGIRKIRLPFLLQTKDSSPDVRILQSEKSSLLTIDYQSTGNDLPNGESGYAEFSFNRE